MPPKPRGRSNPKGASSSHRAKGKRARNSSPPPQPPRVIPLPWPFRDDAHESSYHTMSQRQVVPTRYFHDDSLRAIGLYDEVMHLIGNVGWRDFVEKRYPTCLEITLEMLSSFVVDFSPPRDSDVIRVSFRCMGVDHTWNLASFSRMLGWPPSGEEVIPHRFNSENAWIELTGKPGYTPAESKSSHIRNPALRYIHKFMVTSVSGRGTSQGAVNITELYFLHCMLHGQQLFTAIWFIRNIMHVAKSKVGIICIGGLLTCIAHALGFIPQDGVHTIISGHDAIDLNTLVNMGVCKYMGNHQYQLIDSDGNALAPVQPRLQFPNPPMLIHDDAPLLQVGDATGTSSVPFSTDSSSTSSTGGWSTMMSVIMGRLDLLESNINQRIQSLQAESTIQTLHTRRQLKRIDARLRRLEDQFDFDEEDQNLFNDGADNDGDDDDDDANDDGGAVA